MRILTPTETIGSGAFGTVYKANLTSEKGFSRTVAVKVVLQDHADKEMFIKRMRDEARLLGLLQDDQILKVIDLFQINNRDAIIMEYIDGIDLSQAVSKGQLPPFRAVMEIGAMVAGTLDRAHNARHPRSNEPLGVVHRDVKPANVMMSSSGSLKLLDFGIAQAKFAARESTTGQMVLGTLNYMAPDYIITGEVTPALDVYGIGLTIFELVTGQLFGQPKLREDKHNQRLKEQLDLVESLNADLANLLAGMLHWDPASRPTCKDVESALLILADELRGPGLRRYAAEVVPKVLSDRKATPDTERILGKPINVGVSTLPQSQPDGSEPEFSEAPAVPVPPDAPEAPDIPEAPEHVPTQSTGSDPRQDTDDAPTQIASRVDTLRSLEPPTAEVRKPAKPPLAMAEPAARTSQSVTTDTPSSLSTPPNATAATAILRGVLIGGSVGALAVGLLAIVLFTWFPAVQSP